MTNRSGKVEAVTNFFFWVLKSLQMVTVALKLEKQLLGRKAMTNIDSLLKIKDITDKGQYSRGCGRSFQ